MKRKSSPNSLERLAELEATIIELRRRQETQPKSATVRRMRLAVLIAAFERRRDLVQAELQMKQ
jgi:hypothetical protein